MGMSRIPADVLAAARKYGPSVDGIAAQYRNPVTGGRLSGTALLLKLVSGESGFNANSVSSAGARGLTQFMPSSRAEAIRKYGVDPWKNADQALHAASLHLRGKINGSTGLRGYNPGMSSYTNYILGQKIGSIPGGSRRSSGGGDAGGDGGGGQPTVTTTLIPGQDTGAGSGVAELLASLSQPRPVIQTAGIAPPADSATRYLSSASPAGSMLQTPVNSMGAPQPRQTGIADLLASIQGPGVGAPSVQTTTTSSKTVKDASQVADPRSPTGELATIIQRAANIDAQRLPYKWGGGHGGRITNTRKTVPLDCSGAVSAVLGIDPRVSGQFEKFGSPGRSPSGKGVTIYANGTHVLMEINGHFFGTSASNPGGGAGWIPRGKISPSYLKNFTARHLARFG